MACRAQARKLTRMKPSLLLFLAAVSLTPVFFVTSASNAPPTQPASQYTVPFANYITTAQLPAGKSLSLATMSVRLSGQALLHMNGTVCQAFVQDVSELPSFRILNTSSYFVDILRATPAEPAPAYHVTAAGMTSCNWTMPPASLLCLSAYHLTVVLVQVHNLSK